MTTHRRESTEPCPDRTMRQVTDAAWSARFEPITEDRPVYDFALTIATEAVSTRVALYAAARPRVDLAS